MILQNECGMTDFTMTDKEEIFSKVLRAGRRTYFFDVRETKSGDYYITITESKKFTNEDGSFFYKKHKIYLYKEDFSGFTQLLNEMTSFVLDQKGIEVISERHRKDFKNSSFSNFTNSNNQEPVTTTALAANSTISSKTENTLTEIQSKKEQVLESNTLDNNVSAFTDLNFEDI